MFGRDGRTAVRSDLAIRIRRTGFRPRRANGFAAQAQVAAWARGCAGARAREQAVGRAVAARCWAAHVLAGPKWPNKIVQSQFLFFLFSRKQFDQFELNFYDNFLYKIYPTIFFCSVNSKVASGKYYHENFIQSFRCVFKVVMDF